MPAKICRCKICGRYFRYDNPYHSSRITCSNRCRYELLSRKFSKKVIRKCKECKKPFQTIPSYQKTCCSPQCRHSYMSKLFIGSKSPYWKKTEYLHPGNKKSLRRHILFRDKVCQDCHSSLQLHVHHIDECPKNNEDKNLILLCKQCHALRHKDQPSTVALILANRTYSSHHYAPKICLICKRKFQPRREAITCSPKCGRIQSGITRRGASDT